MRFRYLGLVSLAILFALVSTVPGTGQTTTAGAQPGPAPKTSWGEPDLQGIWTDEYATPLQRPAKFAGKEFFTDAERAELDRIRASRPGREYRDRDASGKGTEQDVAGAYNAVYNPVLPLSRRTSLVVDPPDGRIPPLTPAAAARAKEMRDYRFALLQATNGCRDKLQQCEGGWYDPKPSPKLLEPPPMYNTGRINRHDGPEDESLAGRCMGGRLPDVGGYRRIVQSPGSVSIFYDVGQGQGWIRVIPITSDPHLPSRVRQWWGDSRGRWEGNTLVVDVTNFSPKADFRGSNENLHLIERWTRIDANTLEYAVTIDDPTTWTKPWTIKHEMQKQSDMANRHYTEPRCYEGNAGMPSMLINARFVEKAFAEGRGPDPATMDVALGGPGGGEENADPLAD